MKMMTNPYFARIAAAILLFVACTQSRADESGQAVFLAHDAEAKTLLAKMTLDEKIGQMMQPDQSFLTDPTDVEKYFLGSLLSGGGSGPKNKDDYTLAGWTNLVENYQKHALATRLAIPLLYGVDAVHGHNNIPGATVFPHNIALGCTQDAALVEKIERITAEEVRATDINWVFAPCVTVPQDTRWGRTYEGFSEDPAIVSLLGAAAVRGFQGQNLADPLSVIACAKHFIADGGTAFGSSTTHTKEGAILDEGDSRIDDATLRKIHLPGYIAAINAGVATIMPSYSSWNGVKCSASKYLLTDLLKNELHFEGIVISDYNAIDQVSLDYEADVATCINAGLDMVMMTAQYPKFYDTMHKLIAENRIPMSRIDDAVTRILRVKFAAGLMDKNRSLLADRNLWKSFGSPEHRAVARQAVQESLVLLKNQNNLLPLPATLTRIHVAGRGADNLGMQCGGWTISWQGEMSQPLPGATSILTGIKNAAPKTTAITYSLDGTGASGADIAIAIIGEAPYAEYHGDSRGPSLTPEDLATLANLKQANIPTIVILLSGRPLLLSPDTLSQSNVLLAAWLPGSEGEGIADILFAINGAKPTGKLSFTWPRTLPADPNTPPLFPRAFGLTYENK